MTVVVFMRGVNVGGNKTFRPAALARELSSLEVVNVGAAGTFVVRKSVPSATLRAEIARRLPFEAEIMICTARELETLASREPFPAVASAPGVRRFVSVLAKRPAKPPRLPLSRPEGSAWQVKVVGLEGRFALSLLRPRAGAKLVYPNEVVEKTLGVPATTRGWDTVTRIRAILEAG